MIGEVKILEEIYQKLYQRDIDYSLNIFLCGADTKKKSSIRDLLNNEFKKDAKFNAVYPEFIFANLYGKGGYNLLELEDELAANVDLIIIPLEGVGTYCELGAFAVNKKLLPKIILINDEKYSKIKSFINLGPIELIKKKNKNNIFYFEKGKEKNIIGNVIERVRLRRFEKKISYGLENIFNLSRFTLYLIALFQPISIKEIKILLNKIKESSGEKIKSEHITSAIQILKQKDRIELGFTSSAEEEYSLSEDGHNYVYEELIVKLNVKNNFTRIRCHVLNENYKHKKKSMSKDKKLLV